ncbi:MAG: hypothetical protein K2Q45_01510 [Nitrosomonas sp.]|nr:hypothetical protein [Nitrosomonas sp.]
MEGVDKCITVMGESDMHVLDKIYPKDKDDIEISVEDVIKRVAEKWNFQNSYCFEIRTPGGHVLNKASSLFFNDNATVHLSSAKGRDYALDALENYEVYFGDEAVPMSMVMQKRAFDREMFFYQACSHFNVLEEYHILLSIDEKVENIFYLSPLTKEEPKKMYQVYQVLLPNGVVFEKALRRENPDMDLLLSLACLKAKVEWRLHKLEKQSAFRFNLVEE